MKRHNYIKRYVLSVNELTIGDRILDYKYNLVSIIVKVEKIRSNWLIFLDALLTIIIITIVIIKSIWTMEDIIWMFHALKHIFYRNARTKTWSWFTSCSFIRFRKTIEFNSLFEFYEKLELYDYGNLPKRSRTPDRIFLNLPLQDTTKYNKLRLDKYFEIDFNFWIYIYLH